MREPADPHAWDDNYLCFTKANVVQSILELDWSVAGPLPGKTCVAVNEPADPHAWNDNYLCGGDDYRFRWSYEGKPSSGHCVRINEPADPHAWDDNYLCSDYDYGMVWSFAGPVPGVLCLRMREPADPHAWNDNYLCFTKVDVIHGIVTKTLQASRFNTAGLNDADVDRILGDDSDVLQQNDGSGDVACGVAFSRNGNVTAFATGDGSIDTQAEFNEVNGLAGNVKVVNTITWCGTLKPNVIGCAPIPGNSFVVVPFTPALEGILWAHEYGHTQGLNHRDDDPNAVMNGTITSNRRRVTADECTPFRD
jgi:hypothetical protein